MKKSAQSLLIVFFVSLTVACIHKTGGTVTPWERVTTYNAALADANNTLEQGAEIAVSSNLLSPQQAFPLIQCSAQVANIHLQVTAILKQGQATQANVASIKDLVDQIKASIAALPPSSLGIKNPKSQQNFEQDVSNIGTLADSLLAALETIGGTS